MVMRKPIVVGVLVAAVVSSYLAVHGETGGVRRVAASVGAGKTPGTTPTGYPTPVDLGFLVVPRDYVQAGIHLAPPPAGTSPSVSATMAYGVCSTEGACLVDGKPTAELALFSDDQYRGSQSANDDYSYRDVLAWVVTWRGTSCMVLGPPNRPTSSPVNGTSGCDTVNFIDATSGKFLIAYVGPPAF